MTTMIVDDLGRIPMSPYLTATLTRAADYATAQSHREVTLEHLLLALAEDPEATIVLKSSNIDLPRLTAEVSDYLGRSDDRIDPASTQTIAISADLRRILEAAAAAAKQGRRREINGAIVLAAIVGDGRSTAAHLLRVQGLTFEEAIRALQRATPAPQPQQPAPPQQAPTPAPAPRREPEFEPEPELEADPVTELGAPPPPDLTRPASTEEILASARERLQSRPPDSVGAPLPPQAPIPRANYPAQRTPPPAAPAPYAFDDDVPVTAGSAPPPPAMEPDLPSFGAERPGASGEPPTRWSRPPNPAEATAGPGAPAPSFPPPQPSLPGQHRADTPQTPAQMPGRSWQGADAEVPRTGPPLAADRRRAASSGPFVGSWPLIESGQLVENIPRRMRMGIPVVAEARIARADVKALAEGLAGGGAAFRHEVVVTKAMSVRLRAPDGGFTIENRSPETQWIENVLGFGSDDFASWRWTVTPRARGRRQLQLIVSARTVGADGMTAETALPDQIVDVKVSINYARTAGRWAGWIAAAVIGGMLAKFGETAWVILKLLAAKHLGI